MKRKSIGANASMCVQPTFIIGTYNEDESPDFAPITWVSVTCEGEQYLLVVSMYGTKKTKQNAVRTKQLTANLASADMLPLVDYFGSTSGKNGIKGDVAYSYSESEYVHAPVLDCSRWIYECEVSDSFQTGSSDTFFCRIKNVQIDEKIDIRGPFGIDLTAFDPVIYSGRYHSIGKYLGKIGDFYTP